MSERTLHRGEVVASPATVRHLVVRSLAVEARWLPELAPALPVAVPVPVAHGQPGGDFPWPWAIYRWLPGQDASSAAISDEHRFAVDLAGFLGALQGIDVESVPAGDRPHWYRCDPVAWRDRATRENLRACRQLDGADIDFDLVERMWEDALGLPPSVAAPAWVHTDLTPFNLLVSHGGLSAVIDFGGLAIGDPVIDLTAPWGLLSAAGRSVFRRTLGVDEVRWRLGRAWALTLAVGVLPYYWQTHRAFAAYGLRVLGEVLDDYRRAG